MSILERLKYYFIFVLPGLVILYPVLFNGEIFADSDAVLQLYPALQFFKNSLISGESFIWNQHVMTGFVTAAGLMGGFFSKLNQLVYKNFPVVLGYNWLTFVSFWLTSVFSFEFTRKLSFKKLSGMFVGLTAPWIMANFLWAGNSTVTSGLFILPLLLYLILVFKSQSRLISLLIAILGGAVIGIIAISYHFQWLMQIYIVTGLFALAQDWRSKKLEAIPYLLISAIITGIVALPQYKWLFKLLPFSARGKGLSFSDIQPGMIIPGDFLSFVFPNLSIPKILVHPGFFYIGAVALLFLIYSFFIKKSFDYKFFAWTLALAFLISFKDSPLAWLLHQLPGFADFRELSRFMYVGMFAAVMMAGYGFEVFLMRPATYVLDKVKHWLWLLVSIGLGLFIGISIVFNIYQDNLRQAAFDYFDANYNTEDLHLPQEHYYSVIDHIFNNIGSGITWPHLPITVTMLSLLLAALLMKYGQKLNRSRMAVVFLLISVLNIGIVNYVEMQVKTTKAAGIFDTPQVVDYLKQQSDQEFRVLTLFPGSAVFNLLDTPYGYNATDNVSLMNNMLVPNLNVLHGIDSLDYYDNLMDIKHARLLAYLGSDRAQAGNKLVDLDINFFDKINLFLERLPVAAAYNVKYLISAYAINHQDLKLILTWTTTSHGIPLYLYELPNPRLRYYLTADIQFTHTLDDDLLWAENLASIKSTATLVECLECRQVAQGPGSWQLIQESNSRYVFSVNSQTQQYFVFGQNFLPGWQAFIDGSSTKIYRANYLNQAVLVPAGTHELLFKYDE